MTKQTLHIYTRVSTQTQQDEGTSLESQRELGIKKAEELGFNHKIWNEGGASSHYEDLQNRPVLLSLLSEMDEGNVVHLWVYNNDRLSRNEITAQTIRMALQKHGVTLYTQSGKFDLNNPHDKLIKTIFDGLAQFDNALRTERTRLGKLSRIKQGYWMGGPPPFGYQIKDKKLVLHPEESKWVKQIYEWYSKGKSTEWIKSELDKAGVNTRRKQALWSLGSIQKLLQNTHPVGHYTYVDSKTDEVVKCVCPPIISKTLWNACQEKRKQIFARRGQNNRTKRFYLLRNLLYCGHCGSPMSGRIKEDKNEYLYYCPKKEREWVKSAPKDQDKWKRGKGCSMTRSLNIKATDALVTGKALQLILNKTLVNKVLKQHTSQTLQTSEAEDKDIKLKQLQNKQKRLTKELNNTIQSIADVEAAKILGKQDKRIADKILENLHSVLSTTEMQIEQCEVQIKELQIDDSTITAMRQLEYKPQTVVGKPVDPALIQSLLKAHINKIDVFYEKEKSEHELIIRFKLPLINGSNDLPLNLKKKQKGCVNDADTAYPQSRQHGHGGVNAAFSLFNWHKSCFFEGRVALGDKKT